MSKGNQELTTLSFVGPRFEDHGLELDMLSELIAYKRLVLETAKELWRRKHPDRERLTKGYEERWEIKFYGLQPGSTAVPLMRTVDQPDGQLALVPIFDELDEAAEAIESAVEAAGADRPLPKDFPKNVIPLFAEFGKGLRPGEEILAKARTRTRPARYTFEARTRLAGWQDRTYEDVVDLVGEVRRADLDGCRFALRTDDDRKIEALFPPDQEAVVTEALREHRSRRLRLQGLGEFSTADRVLRRVVRIDNLVVLPPGGEEFDRTARPIWEVISEMGSEISDEEWSHVPSDLSRNFHDHLYGRKARS
jgi:hypothetical protein